ncbi:hypothetical protein [Nocardioides sp. 616]|uniref:hypothetical protein n=1 Tax=Nocardioides sp. 616 TaxID=2268090 RepID=UPI000CE2F16A|nr:hypothetical protein [Nocardioides sp. 616]
MFRLLLPLVLVLCLLALVYVRLQAQARESARRAAIQARVREVTDLAYLHDEISPALAGAVIERTRGLGSETPVAELERALDDVLGLARQHRTSESDLAVIVIDTVRRNELT